MSTTPDGTVLTKVKKKSPQKLVKKNMKVESVIDDVIERLKESIREEEMVKKNADDKILESEPKENGENRLSCDFRSLFLYALLYSLRTKIETYAF